VCSNAEGRMIAMAHVEGIKSVVYALAYCIGDDEMTLGIPVNIIFDEVSGDYSIGVSTVDKKREQIDK